MSFRLYHYRREKICAVCGETFIAKSGNAKYCLPCREKVYKELHDRAKAKYQESLKTDCEKYQRNLESRRKSQKKSYRRGVRKASEMRYQRSEKGLAVRHRAQKKYREKNRELINLNARIKYFDKCVEYWNSRL